ncbi:Tyrosine-protein kinase [Aphelenchoides fujianensis]|nr:Tyrosine-protein kinase [Aphelenchoides fujianensis]
MWRKYTKPRPGSSGNDDYRTGVEKRKAARVPSAIKTDAKGTPVEERRKPSGEKTDELEIGVTLADDHSVEEKRAGSGSKVGSSVYKVRCDAEAEQLLGKSWYHGLMPRDEIEDMLLQDGDFLVRLTELDKAHRLAVSVRWGGRARHILFKLNAAHRWAVRGDADFDSVSKLIAHYVSTKKELQRSGTKLLNPVKRPDWYLLHDSIHMGKKLGSGSFGDVFLARLDQVDGRPIDVAVKTLKGKMGKQKVPVRYLAPETLRAGTFSTKSDVWAYGIMMWELFTCCKADPYPGMSNADVKALVLSGKTMSAPPNMPTAIAALMLRCWNQAPELRPSFGELLQRLAPEIGGTTLEERTGTTEDQP